MIFTFTKHPIKHLLEHHFEMFSGVQKLVAIYADSSDGTLKSSVKSEAQQDELNISDFTTELSKFRKNTAPFSWFDESTLPFRVRQSGIFQQELFDELEKTVLLIRIPSNLDGKNDLLFVYFDRSLSNLALSLSKDSKLSGDTKPLIAKLLYNSVLSVISDAQENQKILKQNFNPGTQSIIQSHKNLKAEYSLLQSQFNNTFLKLVKSLFYKYLDKSKYSITLSEYSLNKLIDFNGDFEELEYVIKNTVSYLTTLYLGDLPETIAVEDYFINTEVNQQGQKVEPETDRYTKTIVLLDNLNDAVKSVIEQNQNPTGALVGKAMQKPISAPAISDALKNHRSKILTLLDRYPNRWTELKQYFKPIQNISIYSSGQNKMVM